MKRVLKYILSIVVAVPVLFVGGIWATYHLAIKGDYITEAHTKHIDGEYCWGYGCRVQEESIEEFLPTFADQMRVMCDAMPHIWQGADYSQMKVYLITKDRTKAWVVDADGIIKKITPAEYLKRHSAKGYDMEFEFDKKEPMTMYVVIGQSDLQNQKRLDKYIYLGTYDPILTVVHEGFHYFIQSKNFKRDKESEGVFRVEKLENTKARVQRGYMELLLREYILSKDPEFLQKARYIWDRYKEQNSKEYNYVRYFDTTEGTAHYIELLSSLSWKNGGFYEKSKLLDMLTSMYKYDKSFAVGATAEAYDLGAMSGFILDIMGDTKWQKEVATNPKTSPLIYLMNKIEPLPNEIPKEIEQELEAKAKKELEHGIYWRPVVKMVYDMMFGG